jgi:TonB family protein
MGGSLVPGSQIERAGSQRKLLRWRAPQFPSVLSEAGQEVECIARITIAPAGNVVRVEIIKASGYTEIDASVEAALRECLFARVESKSDAVEIWRFPYRLEKRD